MENRPGATPGELAQKFGAFRQQYNQGSITPFRFKAILSYFRFTDERGRYWTLGSNTGNWYVWDNGNWVMGTPPGFLFLPAIEETKPVAEANLPARKFCAKCGNPVKPDWKFCQKCGNATL